MNSYSNGRAAWHDYGRWKNEYYRERNYRFERATQNMAAQNSGWHGQTSLSAGFRSVKPSGTQSASEIDQHRTIARSAQ